MNPMVLLQAYASALSRNPHSVMIRQKLEVQLYSRILGARQLETLRGVVLNNLLPAAKAGMPDNGPQEQ